MKAGMISWDLCWCWIQNMNNQCVSHLLLEVFDCVSHQTPGLLSSVLFHHALAAPSQAGAPDTASHRIAAQQPE